MKIALTDNNFSITHNVTVKSVTKATVYVEFKSNTGSEAGVRRDRKLNRTPENASSVRQDGLMLPQIFSGC